MFTNKCIILWAVLLSFKENPAHSFSASVNDTKVCYSNMQSISGYPKSGSIPILKRNFGDGCTHISGNLILTGLHNLENDPVDLSFLQSIREVSGYVIIMYSSVDKIPLPNLRVIRAENGGYRLHSNLTPASLLIRKNFYGRKSLKTIDLRNLNSIVRGSVYIYDNPGLCNWSEHINWTELFESPGEQKVLGKEIVEAETNMDNSELMDAPVLDKQLCLKSPNKSACSSTCSPFADGQRYCWGPSEEQCQAESRCARLNCNRCYNDSDGQFCCHEQCLGGCFGPNPDQCVACKAFDDSGICVPECRSVGSSVRYRLGNICVGECPDGFLVENGVCVTHCTVPGMYAVGRFCKPCAEQCPKICEITHPVSTNGHTMNLLGRDQLKNLTNCTYLKGDLIIDERSFHPSQSTPSHVPLRSVEELWALHSLQEISGYVYLDLGYFGEQLENFTFLENLVKVSGSHNAIKCSVMIMNSAARYPGLRSLRQVPHGSVIFMNNSQLCYVHSLPWLVHGQDSLIYQAMQTRVTGDLHIRSDGNADYRHCASIGALCHQTCDTDYGCWGPGPEHCVRCLNSRAGHSCVSVCDDKLGYMSRPIPNSHELTKTQTAWVIPEEPFSPVPDADSQCLPCHPECRATCSGPGAHECVGGCKKAWADGRCVSQCDPNTYFNADKRICESCHPDCHSRTMTRESVCTGPEAYLGPGGCAKCEKVLITSGLSNELLKNLSTSHSIQTSINKLPAWICIRGLCPLTTYATTELVKPESEFADAAEAYTSLLPVCRACHPLCTKCTAYSVTEASATRQGCVECSGFWFRGRCVQQCPEKDTFTILANVSRSRPDRNTTHISTGHLLATPIRQVNGRCLACHPECHMGCWGPHASQCYHCQNVRVHLSILPPQLLKNHSDLQRIWEEVQKQKLAKNTPPHDILGRGVCLKFCPGSLEFLVTDPFTGDRLCHFESTLSEADNKRIIHENSRHPHPVHPTLNAQVDMSKKTHNRIFLFVTLLLCTTLLVVSLCCCFHRFRRAQKSSSSVFYAIPFFGSRFESASKFMKYTPGSKNKAGDEVELSLLNDLRNGIPHNHSSAPTDSCDGSSQTWRSTKAPNLGRLVMIQSDDLILNERSGPLGTGAFGAVYRGLWRIPFNDNTSTYSTNSLAQNDISADASQSLTTMSTAIPSLEYEEAADSEPGTSQSLLVRPRSETNGECPLPDNPIIKGRTRHKFIQVAVKILNEIRGASDLDALLDEAKVMASVSHRNCLPLLGVCLSQSRKCLVSAYVVNGSLERYLRAHGPELSASLLINWCKQIADGMTYLQSRGIIHRDLATRNVLVTSRDHLQITDFGLAKMLEGEDEENGGELVVRSGRVPIRWLAIETLTQGKYSFKTDVWAYGVTIWEVFTFGKKPYELIETSNVKAHVLAGNRLPQPETCTPEVYRIMLACWLENPQKRPNFATLLAMFQKLSLNPDQYVRSKASGGIKTAGIRSEFGEELNSQVLSYCGFNGSSTSQLSPNTNSVLTSDSQLNNDSETTEEKPVRCGSGPLLLGRRLDPRRRTRCSLIVPSAHHTQAGKFAKYQQQKRRSTGCRPETGTLSTSLSMTSSGLSDRWSHSAFPHHSHPVLSEVQETTTGDIQGDPALNAHKHSQPDHSNSIFHAESLKTDSWASSGQPLLSSDQDSSISQLMLSNLAYTSSGSHASVTNHAEQQSHPVVAHDAQNLPNTESNVRRMSSTVNAFPDTMPLTFEVEAAAGYVWPQWPAVNLDTQPSIPLEINESNSAGDEQLTHLTRQLWLRRNARQRQFYQRQSQMQRSNLGVALTEEASDEALAEADNVWHSRRMGNMNLGDQRDSDAISERYCPDPSSDAVQ